MGLFQDARTDRPCRLCEHYGGLDSSGCHTVCLRGPGVLIKAFPERGCAMWLRVIGADDDDDKQRKNGSTL